MLFCIIIQIVTGIKVIIRAHSFPRKILPNSRSQFAKFRSLPRQNSLYSTVHCGSLCV